MSESLDNISLVNLATASGPQTRSAEDEGKKSSRAPYQASSFDGLLKTFLAEEKAAGGKSKKAKPRTAERQIPTGVSKIKMHGNKLADADRITPADRQSLRQVMDKTVPAEAVQDEIALDDVPPEIAEAAAEAAALILGILFPDAAGFNQPGAGMDPVLPESQGGDTLAMLSRLIDQMNPDARQSGNADMAGLQLGDPAAMADALETANASAEMNIDAVLSSLEELLEGMPRPVLEQAIAKAAEQMGLAEPGQGEAWFAEIAAALDAEIISLESMPEPVTSDKLLAQLQSSIQASGEGALFDAMHGEAETPPDATLEAMIHEIVDPAAASESPTESATVMTEEPAALAEPVETAESPELAIPDQTAETPEHTVPVETTEQSESADPVVPQANQAVENALPDPAVALPESGETADAAIAKNEIPSDAPTAQADQNTVTPAAQEPVPTAVPATPAAENELLQLFKQFLSEKTAESASESPIKNKENVDLEKAIADPAKATELLSEFAEWVDSMAVSEETAALVQTPETTAESLTNAWTREPTTLAPQTQTQNTSASAPSSDWMTRLVQTLTGLSTTAAQPNNASPAQSTVPQPVLGEGVPVQNITPDLAATAALAGQAAQVPQQTQSQSNPQTAAQTSQSASTNAPGNTPQAAAAGTVAASQAAQAAQAVQTGQAGANASTGQGAATGLPAADLGAAIDAVRADAGQGQGATVAAVPNAGTGTATATPGQASQTPVSSMLQQMENIERLTEAMKMANKGGIKNLTMQLSPPELGKVMLKVQSRAGIVSAYIRVEKPEAAAQLNGNLQQLRENLKAQGIELGELEVRQQNQGQMATFGEGRRQRQHNGKAENESSSRARRIGALGGADDTEEIEPADSTRTGGQGGLNLFA